MQKSGLAELGSAKPHLNPLTPSSSIDGLCNTTLTPYNYIKVKNEQILQIKQILHLHAII
jgi:hypothetical protein